MTNVVCLTCRRFAAETGIEYAQCPGHFALSHGGLAAGTFSNVVDHKPLTFADVRRAWIRINNMRHVDE